MTQSTDKLIYIDHKLHHKAKVQAVVQGVTLKRFIENLIEQAVTVI